MKERFFLIKEVKIKDHGVLKPEYVKSIDLIRNRSTSDCLIFVADCLKNKIEFKIYLNRKENENYIDAIQIVDSVKIFLGTEHGEYDNEIFFNKLDIQNESVYITETKDLVLSMNIKQKFPSGKKVKTIECVLKRPNNKIVLRTKKGTVVIADNTDRKLFYSVDNTFESEKYYYFDKYGDKYFVSRNYIDLYYKIKKVDY